MKTSELITLIFLCTVLGLMSVWALWCIFQRKDPETTQAGNAEVELEGRRERETRDGVTLVGRREPSRERGDSRERS